MWEKAKQAPWKKIIPVVILLVTIALNIWLWCMPVFKGSAYIGNSKHYTLNISFNDETFSSIIVEKNDANDEKTKGKFYGFYYVDGDGIKIDGGSGTIGIKDEVNIMTSFKWGYKDYLGRKNVFTIVMTREVHPTVNVYKYEDVVCTNVGAVFLQIFYAIVILASGIKTIKIAKTAFKEKKHKDLQRKQREENLE